MPQLKIRELPRDEWPREKLLTKGASALSEAELIAILLGSGVPGANAVDVARELLREFGPLSALSRRAPKELQKVRGIGPARAVFLAAAFQLGYRLAQEAFAKRKLDTPEAVNDLVGPELRALEKESLRVVLLDTRYQLKRVEEVSLGSLNESIAHPRDLLRPALIHAAYAVVVVHNHPSGDPSPSQSDHSLTRRLAEAAEIMQIRLLDHVIIGAAGNGSPGYFSFKEAGVL